MRATRERARLMFGKFKPVLKQIATLLRDGQLDAAAALLSDPEVAQHREGRRLSQQLGQALLERARHHLQARALFHAWDDLTCARRFAGNDPETARLERDILVAAVELARDELHAGRPDLAIQLIDDLRRRGAQDVSLNALADVARNWHKARRLAQGGDLYGAVDLLRRIEPKASGLKALSRERDEYEQQLERVQKLEGELAEQIAAENWLEVLRTAAALLAELPAHRLAMAARRRAWHALGAGSVSAVQTQSQVAPAEAPAGPGKQPLMEDRCMLHVDGGGSYLICVADHVTIGNRSSNATVPLLANISSSHVEIVRDRGGYVIWPNRPVAINGVQVSRPTPIKRDARITLASGVEFRFRLPSPMSMTALLEPLHSSYLDRRFDAIVLLARFCLVGDDPSCHIHAPDTPRHTLLVERRHPLQFLLRGPGPIRVNNLLAGAEASFPVPANVELPSAKLTILPYDH